MSIRNPRFIASSLCLRCRYAVCARPLTACQFHRRRRLLVVEAARRPVQPLDGLGIESDVDLRQGPQLGLKAVEISRLFDMSIQVTLDRSAQVSPPLAKRSIVPRTGTDSAATGRCMARSSGLVLKRGAQKQPRLEIAVVDRFFKWLVLPTIRAAAQQLHESRAVSPPGRTASSTPA